MRQHRIHTPPARHTTPGVQDRAQRELRRANGKQAHVNGRPEQDRLGVRRRQVTAFPGRVEGASR